MMKLLNKAALLSSSLLLLAGCLDSPAPETDLKAVPPVQQTPDNELFIYTVSGRSASNIRAPRLRRDIRLNR